MSEEQTAIEALRGWSQFLLWISMILPILGGFAAGARYYVERHEKTLSSRLTAANIQKAHDVAKSTARDLAKLKEEEAPRTVSEAQRATLKSLLPVLTGKPISFACKLMDGESCDFAGVLADVFREAGCAVPEVVRTSLNEFPGYLVVASDGSSDPAVAAQVADLLKQTGIDTRPEKISTGSISVWHAGHTCIVVGRRK